MISGIINKISEGFWPEYDGRSCNAQSCAIVILEPISWSKGDRDASTEHYSSINGIGFVGYDNVIGEATILEFNPYPVDIVAGSEWIAIDINGSTSRSSVFWKNVTFEANFVIEFHRVIDSCSWNEHSHGTTNVCCIINKQTASECKHVMTWLHWVLVAKDYIQSTTFENRCTVLRKVRVYNCYLVKFWLPTNVYEQCTTSQGCVVSKDAVTDKDFEVVLVIQEDVQSTATFTHVFVYIVNIISRIWYKTAVYDRDICIRLDPRIAIDSCIAVIYIDTTTSQAARAMNIIVNE